MDWQDTVMNEKQLEKVEESYLDEDFSVNVIRLHRGGTEDLMRKVAEAQAKISFEAGIAEMPEYDLVLEKLGKVQAVLAQIRQQLAEKR